MKKLRKLEDDMFEEKNTNFRTHKSKKQWVTSCQTLLSRLAGHSIQMFARGGNLIVSSKKVRNLVIATLLVFGIGGGTVATSHFVLAAPPDSGTVSWTPQNSIVHFSNGDEMTYLSLNDGSPVYCLAVGVPLTNSSTSAQRDAMNAIWKKLTSEEQGVINNIAYLANQAGAATNRVIYTSAQIAIWHQLQVYGVGHGDVTPSMISSFGPDSSGVTVAGVQSEFDNLISQAKNLTELPSFNGQTIKVIAGVDKAVPDTNDVLTKFPFIRSNISGLNASVSGNILNLKADSTAKTGTSSNSIQLRNATSQQYPKGLPPFIYSTNGDSSGTSSQPVIAATDPSAETATLNVNITLDGSLKIIKTQTKQDSHQGSGGIAGAKFDVTMYLSDGKTVDTGINGSYDTVDSDGNKTGTVTFTKGVAQDVTTGTDGSVIIKDFSPVGDIAKAQETDVPAPYTLGHTDSTGKLVNAPVTATISQDENGISETDFTDNKQVGGLTIQKSGLYSGTAMLNNLYSLEGNVFTVNDKDGNVVQTLTTNAAGIAKSTDDSAQSPLVIGETYTIAESQSSANFANTFASKTVTFTYKGKDQVIDWESVSGTNTEITGNVEFDKTVLDATTNGKTADTQNANLSIYYREDVKDSTGKVIHKAGDLVSLNDGFAKKPITITDGKEDEAAIPSENQDLTVRIGSDNKWKVNSLPAGKYYAQETQEGLGETRNTTKFNFDISKQDDKTKVITVKDGVSNQALRWNMMFTKVLEENSSLTGLNGAKFQVTGLDDNTKTAFTNYGFTGKGDTATSGTATSNNGFTTDGLTAFYNIPLGTIPDKDDYIARYQIKEIETPKGTKTIVPINIDVKVNLDSDGAPQSYTFNIYWSDTKQMIHTETYSTATLLDSNVLTIRPDLGLIADEFITQPAITTTAVDAGDNDETLGVGLAKIHDTAKVANLTPSTDYTLTGKAVLKSDGSAVLGEDGKEVTSTVKFTSDPRGNATVDLDTPDFEDTKYQGKEITMLETVTDKNGGDVVKEDNWKNNPTQTVSVSKVEGSTQVKDSILKIGSNVTMTDTYHYKGLVPGQKYTVKVTTASINHTDKTIPVKGQITFTPKVSDGDIDIPITLNTMDDVGDDLTFTNEALYLGSDTNVSPIINNNNPKEPKETVHVNKPQPHKDETNSPTAGIKDDSMRNDDKDISPSNFKLIGDSSKNQAVESDESYEAIVKATAKNPYIDKADNNQDFNLNTQTVKRGQKLFYVLTLDTIPYDQTSLVTTMGMEDTIDTSMLDVDVSNIKAYDASGKEVVKGGFDNKLNGKTLTMNMNIFKSIFVDKNGVEVSKGTEGAKEVKVVDTSKLPLGQQYKIVVPATVKPDAAADKDIVNVARQIVINASGKQLSMQTETRVNKLKLSSPETPVDKVVNIFLPKTGDAKSIWTALGAWMVTIAVVAGGLVLNERKRHTLVKAYHKTARKLRK